MALDLPATDLIGSLDEYNQGIWAAIQADYQEYGFGYASRIGGLLERASSPQVQRIFVATIKEAAVNKESHFRDTGNSDSSPNNSHKTRASESERPKKEPYIDDEITEILNKSVTRERQNGWLQNTDHLLIRKVVNTVILLRQKAKQEGKEITDRDIYLQFRMKLEAMDEGGKGTSLYTPFQILTALMGGSVNGKLPF